MNSDSQSYSSIPYVIGFALSIVFTLAAYFLVRYHGGSGHEVISHSALIFAIVAFAIAQLVVQLVFFLHVGTKGESSWNTIAFMYTALLVVCLVGGSLWIMYHLEYNMMLMPPIQVDTYMLDR